MTCSPATKLRPSATMATALHHQTLNSCKDDLYPLIGLRYIATLVRGVALGERIAVDGIGHLLPALPSN